MREPSKRRSTIITDAEAAAWRKRRGKPRLDELSRKERLRDKHDLFYSFYDRAIENGDIGALADYIRKWCTIPHDPEVCAFIADVMDGKPGLRRRNRPTLSAIASRNLEIAVFVLWLERKGDRAPIKKAAGFFKVSRRTVQDAGNPPDEAVIEQIIEARAAAWERGIAECAGK